MKSRRKTCEIRFRDRIKKLWFLGDEHALVFVGFECGEVWRGRGWRGGKVVEVFGEEHVVLVVVF